MQIGMKILGKRFISSDGKELVLEKDKPHTFFVDGEIVFEALLILTGYSFV